MARTPYAYAPEGAFNNEVTISGQEAVHLHSVLRLRVGDLFTAFDGKGRGWVCTVQSVEAKRLRGEVREVLPLEPEPALKLTAATAVVKGVHIEWAVEKAAELGVERFVPLLTQRGVASPGAGRLERWRSIALAAAKQSQRRTLMQILDPLTIEGLLNIAGNNDYLCALENQCPDCTLGHYAFSLKSGISLILIVGPEGGFTPEELCIFRAHSTPLVSMGDHPLRTETALVVAAGYLMLTV
ncbi:MAG: 16S rRNA (uracil(1498)-N(3))-methyltransferase, partial [Calditrichota bacterium]